MHKRQLFAAAAGVVLVAAASSARAEAGAETLVLAAATEVDAVIVTGAADDGYAARRTSTATRTDTPLLDVPQAVSVITREVIADQSMQSMADVLRYVPGVGAGQGEGNRDAPVLRGQASTADFYVDGVRDDVQYFRDLYNAERIEVLKGPNAMTFGRGGGGGVINRVTRKADGRSLREITLEAGSFDHKRLTVDLDQPLGGAWSGRIVGVYEDSGSFRDGVELDRWALNPTLRYASTERFTAVLGYEHADDRRTADRGIPSFDNRPSPADRETFFGAPDQSHAQVTADVFTVVGEVRLSETLVLRDHLLAGDYDKFYQNIYPSMAADLPVSGQPTRATLAAYNNSSRRRSLFNQTDLVWQTSSGGVGHTVLAGAEIGRQTTDNFRNSGFFGTSTSLTVPFATPTLAGAPASFRQTAADADNHVRAKVAAAYLQDQVEFGRLQLVAGIRYDSFDLDFRNNRTGETFSRRDETVSPRAGLVFKPAEALSLYASYAVSFLPSSGDQFTSLTATTAAFEPERFENHEVGLKWDAGPGLSITAAAYELVRDHTSARDPLDATRTILAGEQRTRGLELGLAGQVTERWQVIGGYAWQNAKITEATVASVVAGKHVPLTPVHTASMWNKLTLSARWGVGLGVVHQTEQFAAIDNAVVLPGFTRLDGAVFFKVSDKVRLQANVENLADRRYFPNANGANNIGVGAPRSLRVSLQAGF
ncbi:MAG: TonB-dependent receptor [Caulobacteraceae bacterium]|nr:TonB-dependent receptor [Caulobacteraceae bacterium]